MLTSDETGKGFCVSDLPKRSHSKTGRIAIKDGTRICIIDPSDVLAIVAQGDCVLLERETGSHILRMSISVIAEKLERFGFVRIHRSALINSAWVEEMRSQKTGEHQLRLKGGREFTVTRTYRKNLRSLAEVWLGNGAFIDRQAVR